MKTTQKKQLALSKMKSKANKQKIQSKRYNCGEYSECLIDDLTNINWTKDSKAYSNGSDNPVYGSIKSDNCTILQSTEYHTKPALINHYQNTVYSKVFTYVHYTRESIELLIFTKQQFIKILKEFSYLDTSSKAKGSKSKIRLSLSQKRINIIKYKMFKDLKIEVL